MRMAEQNAENARNCTGKYPDKAGKWPQMARKRFEQPTERPRVDPCYCVHFLCPSAGSAINKTYRLMVKQIFLSKTRSYVARRKKHILPDSKTNHTSVSGAFRKFRLILDPAPRFAPLKRDRAAASDENCRDCLSVINPENLSKSAFDFEVNDAVCASARLCIRWPVKGLVEVIRSS